MIKWQPKMLYCSIPSTEYTLETYLLNQQRELGRACKKVQLCGDHFGMYRNTESLCCVPETKIMLWVSYTSKPTKQTHRKRDQIGGYQRWGGGGCEGMGNWMKVVKGYKLPVKR